MANPGITYRLTNGKLSVAHTQSRMPSLQAISGRATPILGEECCEVCFTWFQVGWINGSKHWVALNQVVKAFDQRDKEALPTYTFKEC